MTLDPMEVMKAMLAQKGKGKQVDPEAESESESDASDGSEDEESLEASVDEEGEIEEGVEDGSGSGSEAESSRSAEVRTKRQSPPTSRIPTTSTSRVSQTASTKAKSPLSAFDQQIKPPADTTFESLGMSKPLISALASINIKKPTEIQSACLGPIMSGRDCIGGAKTGSGKTLAFALPIVERIARDPFGVWAVVLTPTR